MRPSLVSALWIVFGVCMIAGSIGLLVGLSAEVGVISGAMRSGNSFDMVLVIEMAVVAAVVALLYGSIRQARRR
jgi:hypothetical protein